MDHSINPNKATKRSRVQREREDKQIIRHAVSKARSDFSSKLSKPQADFDISQLEEAIRQDDQCASIGMTIPKLGQKRIRMTPPFLATPAKKCKEVSKKAKTISVKQPDSQAQTCASCETPITESSVESSIETNSKCLRCARSVHPGCMDQSTRFCQTCQGQFEQFKKTHFVRPPVQAEKQLVKPQTAASSNHKLIDFFNTSKSKPKSDLSDVNVNRIQIESSANEEAFCSDDSEFELNAKAKKSPRAKSNAPSKQIPMSQSYKVGLSNVQSKAKSKGSRSRSKRRRPFSLTMKRKRRDIFKIVECTTEQETATVHESFAWAFFGKKMSYATELVYDDPKCPVKTNDPVRLEPKLQKLDLENKRVLEKFRAANRKGTLPPVVMKADQRQGFYVEAACDLPELTLLAEYLGQVRTDRQTMFVKNDSIMELLCCQRQDSQGNTVQDHDKSLVVVPFIHSNIARFFNGINNSEKGSKVIKQNVRTMRCQVDGKAAVLLYTKRAVRKGEQLLYDYNEAGKNLYPTHDFI